MLNYVLLVITSLLWGGNFVAGKFTSGHASALTMTDFRWGLGVLVLVPYVWWKERRLLPPRKAIVPLVCMGLTGVVGFNILMFLALERTSADNAGLLSALNPVSIALVSFVLLREKLTFRQVGSMLLSLLGVLIVISHGDLQKVLQLHFNSGDLMMLGAVFVWGFYSVAGKLAMKHASPLMSTMWAGIFGVTMLLPFDLATLQIHSPEPSFWISTVYLAVGGTTLAMVFWNIGVQRLGGTKAGMFLNLNPIFTALLAFLLLEEKMVLSQWIGTAVVIVGVYLFAVSGAKKSDHARMAANYSK